MLIALVILIILVCLLLGLIVLIQNPKGGGLSSTFGGVGNQILGASKSTDFVEKATWALGGALMVLSLVSGVFYEGKNAGVIDEPAVRSYEERINESFEYSGGGQQQQQTPPPPPQNQPE